MPPETELPSNRPPTPDVTEQLAHLTRSWRERLEPTTPTSGARRRDIVTQEQFAHLIGYTVGWYRKLELGEQANFSDDFLESVSAGFQLDDAEKTLLYLLASGREPPTPTGPTGVSADDTLQRILEAQPWPAVIYNEAWEIISVNVHMREWFPWARPGVNIMRWVFTSKEARVQLHRWREDWAPLMIAKVRLALARSPDNQAVTQLISTILQASREARKLWKIPNAQAAHAGPRSLNLPYHGRIQPIEAVTFDAVAPPHIRMALIVPCLPPTSGPAEH